MFRWNLLRVSSQLPVWQGGVSFGCAGECSDSIYGTCAGNVARRSMGLVQGVWRFDLWDLWRECGEAIHGTCAGECGEAIYGTCAGECGEAIYGTYAGECGEAIHGICAG